VAILEIKTADELFDDQELAARWTARRTARQTEVFRKILRGFLDRGGPIPVPDIVGVSSDAATVHDALVALDDDDLIRIRDGQVDIAYPFSASPTPFVVRPPGGEARYACCAVDALGIAPMAGIRVEIRSRCHHCTTPVALSVDPDGLRAEADGIMLWVGKMSDDRCRVADSL
jgi:hypothetical protein